MAEHPLSKREVTGSNPVGGLHFYWGWRPALWGKNPEVVGNGLSGGRNVFFFQRHSTAQHSATKHSIAQHMSRNQVKKPRYWPCRAECNSFGRRVVGCPLGMFGALWATHHICFNQLKNPGMLTLSRKMQCTLCERFGHSIKVVSNIMVAAII